MTTGPRRRLTPDERRRELIEVGATFFVSMPYEEVRVEDIAAKAGVSRALMYRYFPAKRDLFAAIFRRDSKRLLDASAIDPTLPLPEQVLSGLEAHLDYFAANRDTILTANRGALAGDPTVQAIISDQLMTLRSRMLAAFDASQRNQLLSTALDGWLAFVRAVCIDWLADDDLGGEEVRDLCVHALNGILAGLDVSLDAQHS